MSYKAKFRLVLAVGESKISGFFVEVTNQCERNELDANDKSQNTLYVDVRLEESRNLRPSHIA